MKATDCLGWASSRIQVAYPSDFPRISRPAIKHVIFLVSCRLHHASRILPMNEFRFRFPPFASLEFFSPETAPAPPSRLRSCYLACRVCVRGSMYPTVAAFALISLALALLVLLRSSELLSRAHRSLLPRSLVRSRVRWIRTIRAKAKMFSWKVRVLPRFPGLSRPSESDCGRRRK